MFRILKQVQHGSFPAWALWWVTAGKAATRLMRPPQTSHGTGPHKSYSQTLRAWGSHLGLKLHPPQPSPCPRIFIWEQQM